MCVGASNPGRETGGRVCSRQRYQMQLTAKVRACSVYIASARGTKAPCRTAPIEPLVSPAIPPRRAGGRKPMAETTTGRTYANLLCAVAREMIASRRYLACASVAEEEDRR